MERVAWKEEVPPRVEWTNLLSGFVPQQLEVVMYTLDQSPFES